MYYHLALLYFLDEMLKMFLTQVNKWSFSQPVTWKYAGADIYLNLWRYVSIKGQGHFLTLAPGHLHMKIKTCFSKKPLGNF